MAKAKEKRPLSIVDRRLASGTIFGSNSQPIPLVEPDRWTLRIVNTKVSNSHLYNMQAEKGWVYAAPEDLAVKPEEVGLQVLDGRVVRGTQGDEVLMKMEKQDYKSIQKMKDAENRKRTFGLKQNKTDIVNAAAGSLGEEGAAYLNRAINRVNIVDSREPMQADE